MNGSLKEVNIKYDLPTVDSAIKRITFNIRNGRASGISAVKIVHGYGSTGSGGKIRTEARRYLETQKKRGFIHDFIPGEKFSIFDDATRKAFQFCDQLRRDSDLERHNNGITIVILK
ncbi:MAG: Smr/MutS family protein [Oscillospiraceae bacterium]|nr:Smr/MutS family protein [Oscillospiraceae bacterium]